MNHRLGWVICLSAFVGDALVTKPIGANESYNKLPIVRTWKYDGADGSVWGDQTYGGRVQGRGLLILPGLKREDVEPYRLSSTQTIFRVKSTDRCFMVAHYRPKGEDNGFGVHIIRFEGGGEDFSLVWGKPTRAEWGLKFLPRFTSLTAISFETNETFPADGLTYLAGMKSLMSLTLSGPRITDEVLASISAVSLRTLSIHDAPVTDAGLPALKKLPSLSQLSLIRTKAEGTGLAALRDLNIWQIDLTESPVTADGVQVLSDWPGLQWITLDRTTIDDAAIPALSRLSATKVSLRGVKMSPDGAKRYWASKPAFVSVELAVTGYSGFVNREQQTILLSLRDATLTSLLEEGGEVDVLEPRDAQEVTRLQAGDILKDKPFIKFRIKRISLRNCVRSDDDLARFGSVVCGYRTQPDLIDLEGTPIQGVGFRAWGGHGIDEVNLNRTKLDDEGLKWLSQVPINRLHLDNTRITDAGTTWFQTRLHALTINETATGDKTLANMARYGGAANLLELEMDGTDVTDEGLKHIEAFPQLRRLSLNQTQVTQAGVRLVNRLRPNCAVIIDD